MIITDRKKAAGQILARLHPASGETEEADGAGGDSKVALAGEVKKAIQHGTDQELADALEAFFRMTCSDDDTEA